MEEFKQLEIYLFPIVMLLAIGMNNWKREERTQGDRIFGFLPFLIICMMGSDVTYHALQLYVHRFTVLYAGYLVYCFFLTAVPYAWLLYVNGKLSVRHNRRWTAAVCHVMTGTAIAVVLLTVIIPWRLSTEGWGVHAVSYSLNHGSLPAKLVSIAMYLMGLILTATAYPKEVTKEGQKETRYLLEAGVFSLVGGMVQSFAESWRTGGPFVALAVLFIYLNAQNRQITTDGLTGLNNRREFDAHLQRKIELCPEHEWGLLMIDVDDFKRINDELGHAVGDEALWHTADILRGVFGKDPVFLARYGGDEFAVLGDWFGQEQIEEAIARIQEGIDRFNKEGQLPLQLSMSIGYAFWHEAGRRGENLIQQADERMYEEKQKKKRMRAESAVHGEADCVSTAAFLQINFIPAIALLMMRHNTRQTLSFSWRTRVLRTEMLLFVLLLLCRTAILCNLGKGGFGPRILLKGLGVWYAFGLLACAYLCFLYVLDVAQDGNGQRGIKCWILAIPALIGSAVLLSNPWTKAVYFINMVNYYKKGPAAYLIPAVGMLYLVVAFLLAAFGALRAGSAQRRGELGKLAAAFLFPAAGILVEKIFSMDAAWAFTVAALLWVYLGIQKGQVTQDGLTGLNNRRRLDQYMWELDERSGERETCCYLLMDVNKFKKVNDTYGHVTGDEVLRLVAEQLKRTFGNMQAFLARYGGDEFVVIVKGKTQDEMDVIIHQTQENVNAIAWGADTPWQLSISIGCAMRGEQGKQKSHELLALADERMYRQKKGIQDR